VTITKCDITNNSAEGVYTKGGGIYGWGSNPTITSCIITGNRANIGGGVSECRGPITNCTITGNSAEYGGGLGECDGPISNCIIWNNVADNSSQLYRSAEPTYSCIQDWSSGGEGNIDADPCFVELGYWDTNGTPYDVNDDFWVDGDYHLPRTSPCIDAGDPNYIPGPNETDLDGNARLLDGDEDGIPIVDMGAYEYRPPTPAELVAELLEGVGGLELPRGIANSLLAKLDTALQKLEDANEKNDVAAINSLQAFINAIEAQRGKKIPEADADALIAAAQEIIDLLSTE
jgi:hypothetical protein